MLNSNSPYPDIVPAYQPLIDRLIQTGYPSALMDTAFHTLWVSSQQAMQYLTVFMLSMPGGDALTEPLLLTAHPVLLSRTVPPVWCYAEVAELDNKKYYQFTFRPANPENEPVSGDMMTLLTGLNDFTDYQVSEILHTAESLRKLRSGSDQQILNDAAQRLEEAAAALSNRVLHLREMQWYQNIRDSANADFRIQNIAESLFAFSEGIAALLGTIMEITPAQIAAGLYAKMDPKRLEFILLTAVGMMKQTVPTLNRFAFRAYQEHDEIRIVLQFSKSGTEFPTDALRQIPSAEHDPTDTSDSSLIRQFCAVFHAKWETAFDTSCAEGTLSLPAFAPDDTHFTFCEPIDYRAERFRYFALYPTRLSAYFHLRYLHL